MDRRIFMPAVLAFAASAPVWAQNYGVAQNIVTSGLTQPVAMYAAPGDNTRLYVVEKDGDIRVITVGVDGQGAPTYTLENTPFLDLQALDAANPFFRDTEDVPLRDQSNTIVPRLVRHGGAPVPHDNELWTPLRDSEQGFYGLAFAPDYPVSGKCYVYYTQANPNTDPGDAIPDGDINWSYYVSGSSFSCNDPGRVVVVEFTRDSNNPDQVNPASERLIMAVPKPYVGHNGGTLGFGPDGYLYLGIGDGGSDHDEDNRSLNPNLLLGKMLRIDVTGDDFPADPERNYGIPADNPYSAGGGGAPEVWARGLRNPWRWSFDLWNGDLWISDVGNTSWEEINHVPGNGGPGRNYGWRAMEGTHATGYDTTGFDTSNLTAPVYDYPHSLGQPGADGYQQWQTGVCIAGGYVYRGSAIRPWRGRYFFADTFFQKLWSATLDDQGQFTDLQDLTLPIVNGAASQILKYVTSFCQDNYGEIYTVEMVHGRIRKIVPQGAQPAIADIGQQGGTAGPDGFWDNNDFVVFIDWFFNNDPRADIGVQGGAYGADQHLDNNDFIVFIDKFFLLQ